MCKNAPSYPSQAVVPKRFAARTQGSWSVQALRALSQRDFVRWKWSARRGTIIELAKGTGSARKKQLKVPKVSPADTYLWSTPVFQWAPASSQTISDTPRVRTNLGLQILVWSHSALGDSHLAESVRISGGIYWDIRLLRHDGRTLRSGSRPVSSAVAQAVEIACKLSRSYWV